MIIIIFNSTHDALAAEQNLLANNYSLRIIPTPRQFTHSCGLSIRLDTDDWEEIKGLLREKGIRECTVYSIAKREEETIYELLGGQL